MNFSVAFSTFLMKNCVVFQEYPLFDSKTSFESAGENFKEFITQTRYDCDLDLLLRIFILGLGINAVCSDTLRELSREVRKPIYSQKIEPVNANNNNNIYFHQRASTNSIAFGTIVDEQHSDEWKTTNIDDFDYMRCLHEPSDEYINSYNQRVYEDLIAECDEQDQTIRDHDSIELKKEEEKITDWDDFDYMRCLHEPSNESVIAYNRSVYENLIAEWGEQYERSDIKESDTSIENSKDERIADCDDFDYMRCLHEPSDEYIIAYNQSVYEQLVAEWDKDNFTEINQVQNSFVDDDDFDYQRCIHEPSDEYMIAYNRSVYLDIVGEDDDDEKEISKVKNEANDVNTTVNNLEEEEDDDDDLMPPPVIDWSEVPQGEPDPSAIPEWAIIPEWKPAN